MKGSAAFPEKKDPVQKPKQKKVTQTIRK